MSTDEFYICDLRPEWNGRPYITFWRDQNAGYAYSLPWSGKYSRQTVDEGGAYYTRQIEGVIERFAVPVAVVEALGIPPKPKIIDGDVGPVVANNVRNREKLRARMYLPMKTAD